MIHERNHTPVPETPSAARRRRREIIAATNKRCEALALRLYRAEARMVRAVHGWEKLRAAYRRAENARRRAEDDDRIQSGGKP